MGFWSIEPARGAGSEGVHVRVVIVEPGVIATPIFSKARPAPQDSPYPHLRRLRALFSASLAKPTSPYVVGEQIRQIVEGDSWQLRYPIGPDAVPFLKWRASVSPAIVSRVLRRLGLNKLNALEPAEPVPGELIHIDIKKLDRIGSVGHRITGRQTGVVNRHLGIGWEYVHVCIDDASRVAFVQDNRSGATERSLKSA